MVRTMKLDLEATLNEKVPCNSPVFAWLVEFAADCLIKFTVGVDGLTPYQRLKGKEWSGEVHKFGCLVHHMAPGKKKGGVTQQRWLDGVYLGSRFDSQEIIVAMPDGRIVRAGSVDDFPVETQWCAKSLLGITGLPWQPTVL